MLENFTKQEIIEEVEAHYILEKQTFYYVLVLSLWLITAYFTFGFEISSLTAKQNLLLNFVLFLFFATMMILTPFFQKLFFKNSVRVNEESDFMAESIILEKDEKTASNAFLGLSSLIQSSQFYFCPSRKLQKRCLIIIACCILFEMFFVFAWIDELRLVWQPDWVSAIIDFIRNNSQDIDSKNRIGISLFFFLRRFRKCRKNIF